MRLMGGRWFAGAGSSVSAASLIVGLPLQLVLAYSNDLVVTTCLILKGNDGIDHDRRITLES